MPGYCRSFIDSSERDKVWW